MFRGQTKLSVDAKGRVAIPKAHRDRVAEEGVDKLVITADPMAKCVVIYPYPVWIHIENQISQLPNLNPLARSLQRYFIGFADEQEFDGTGRIMISPALREFGKIDKKVVLVGLKTKFELWSEEAWEAELGNAQEEIAETDWSQIPDVLQSLSL